MRPPFSFPRKKTGVARPKERRFPLQASSSKNCNACPIVLPCARRCRVWCCYTTWPTSTTRCRSAHLVFVQPNHLLSAIHIVLVMRTAASTAMPPWQATTELIKSKVDGNCVRPPTRRHSDSEDRRKSNRIATKIAGTRFGKRRSSSSCSLAMSKPFSWGIKRGRFSFVKENLPLYPSPARRREPNPFPKGK